MAGILDRYHRYVVDGRPIVTGVAAVGDSWACTNPSAGRGITVGLIHAQALRNVVRSTLGDPEGLARAWDAATETEVAPLLEPDPSRSSAYRRNERAGRGARAAVG